MKTKGPRATFVLADGQKACVRCIERGAFPPRPARPYPRNNRIGVRQFYSYCKECHNDYSRERRSGKIETLLTPAEMDLIRELRTAQPAGKHHARADTRPIRGE